MQKVIRLSTPDNTCPICGGLANSLGTLGNLAHFRCQNCGMDFHKDASLFEDTEDCDHEDGAWSDDEDTGAQRYVMRRGCDDY